MTLIRSSADLRNRYNDISKQCHAYDEPVYITKNGKGDLVVMSIESYERMRGRLELYHQISEGVDDILNGDTRSFSEAMSDIKAGRKR